MSCPVQHQRNLGSTAAFVKRLLVAIQVSRSLYFILIPGIFILWYEDSAAMLSLLSLLALAQLTSAGLDVDLDSPGT